MRASALHPRHLRPCHAGAVALALLLSSPADAQIYKWIDAAGGVHYSQTPPPSQTYTEMPVAPASSSADQETEQAQDLIKREEDNATRAEVDKQKVAEQAKQMAARAALCVKARDDLAGLTTGSDHRHLVRDADGSTRRLSDGEHADLVARVQKAVADNCGE